MAASVRVEADAFDDVRFEMLGNRLGTNAFDALGRMIHVWRYCTQKACHMATQEALNIIAKHGQFASLATESGLLELTPTGEYRVRGTRGRIEWLQNLRINAKKGGRAKAAKRQPKGVPDACPPTPIPIPSPTKETEEILSGALSYLNQLTGRKFEPTDLRRRHIKRILSDGRRLEDIRVVIWSKCMGPRKWLGDEKMDPHVNPDTLLRPANFQRYLEAAREELAKAKPARARELGYIEPEPPKATPMLAGLTASLKGDKK